MKFKNNSIKKYKITDNYFGEFDLYLKVNTEKDFKTVYENNLQTKRK